MAEESIDFSRHIREHSSALAIPLAHTSRSANGNGDGGSSTGSAAATPTTDRSKLIVNPSTNQLKHSTLTAKLEVEDERNGVSEDEANLKFYCGIGSFRPKLLRIFSNAKFFTFLLCVYAFVQGSIVSGERQGSSFIFSLSCLLKLVRRILCSWRRPSSPQNEESTLAAWCYDNLS